MKYCLISLDAIDESETYSLKALKKISPILTTIRPLAYTEKEQQAEAILRVGKMSIQGVQPKLSAVLDIKNKQFTIVNAKGKYILKIQSPLYQELPQNEALTMLLAKSVGIETPLFGLIQAKDQSLLYFIKRFDRVGHNKKLAVEDFCQLAMLNRNTKYNASMEKVIDLVNTYCTFPKKDGLKLFKLMLFNFLIGNEDMHLKNFSVIRKNQIITLSPAYDLVNSSIALKNPKEELALPLNGKKNNLQANDFFKYLANLRLGLNTTMINQVTLEFKKQMITWPDLIERSFLSPVLKEAYKKLLNERIERLKL